MKLLLQKKPLIAFVLTSFVAAPPLVLGFGLSACTGPNLTPNDDDDDNGSDDDDDDSSTDLGTESSADSQDETTDTGADNTSEVSVTLKGKALDANGDTLPKPWAQFCGPREGKSSCIPLQDMEVDDEGAFVIKPTMKFEAGTYDFVLRQAPTDKFSYSGSPNLVKITEEGEVEIGSIKLPFTATWTTIEADQAYDLQVDDELTIHLAKGSNYGGDLGAVKVDNELWPSHISTEIDGTILAAWAFCGYATLGLNTKDGASAGITLVNSFDLKADSTVDLYQFDSATGEAIKVTTAKVSADGKTIASDDDEGLTELTWLFVVKPE